MSFPKATVAQDLSRHTAGSRGASQCSGESSPSTCNRRLVQKAVTGWDQLRRGSHLSQLLQLIEMTRPPCWPPGWPRPFLSPLMYQHEGAHTSLDSSCEQNSWSRSENSHLRPEVEWGPRQEDPCSGLPIGYTSPRKQFWSASSPAVPPLLFHFSPPQLREQNP